MDPLSSISCVQKQRPKREPRKSHPCLYYITNQPQPNNGNKTISQLITGAFFFACRSCEYLKVSKPDDKRTKLLTLKNINFYKNGTVLNHSSDRNLLQTANSVSITFKTQKNERKFDTITQWRTHDPILCPVKQWANIVTRISSYRGATKNTPVSTVWRYNHLDQITTAEVITTLQDAVKAYGEDDL